LFENLVVLRRISVKGFGSAHKRLDSGLQIVQIGVDAGQSMLHIQGQTPIQLIPSCCPYE